MRHNKPRFRQKARLAAIKRRRKVMEFLVGPTSEETPILSKDKNPIRITR